MDEKQEALNRYLEDRAHKRASMEFLIDHHKAVIMDVLGEAIQAQRKDDEAEAAAKESYGAF